MVAKARMEGWLEDWNPAESALTDPMSAGPTRALAAVLDCQRPSSDTVAPLWHWVHFLEWPATSALGGDGHPIGGALDPPIPERSRMFVGGRLELRGDLHLGQAAERRSTVARREVKEGTTGTMLFVTVRHEIRQAGEVVILEDQDLMYRSGATARRGGITPSIEDVTPGAPWQEQFRAGPVLLFRFSALTGNSHRIHYDREYATGVEGYRDLVVHGPLLAVALGRLVTKNGHGRRVESLRYRFVRPVFSGDALVLAGGPTVGGNGAEVAALAADGEASARLWVAYR
jgi:3-methylfumaryl-CoA hydratase